MKTSLSITALLCLLLAPGCGGGTSATSTPGSSTSLAPPSSPDVPRVLLDVEDDEDDLGEIVAEYGLRNVRKISGTSFFVADLPPGLTAEELDEQLDGDIRVVESGEDPIASAPEGGGATLPLGGEFFSLDVLNQLALDRIGATQAQQAVTGQGLVVAIIDSGYTEDPILTARVLPGGRDFVDGDASPIDEPDFLDNDGDGQIDEGFGHGAFVMSLILAVAPDAGFLHYRVLNSDSIGTVSAVAEAIVTAVDAGADVINLSAGMNTGARVIREAIQYARGLDVAVIASAGNSGLEDVTFPASVSEAFSVTSVDASDRRPGFASFGSDVDLAAPGVDLVGIHPRSVNGARSWSGTSFSAALVTGAWCLVKQRWPSLDADGVLDHLQETAMDIDAMNPTASGRLGDGRLDVAAAVSTAP